MIQRVLQIIGVLFTAAPLLAQEVGLQSAWESETILSVNESVLLDRSANVLYVSCINGPAANDNNNSFIAKVGLDGKVLDLHFTEHLNAPKGMCLSDTKLYVTEMQHLVEIDRATGKILKRYFVKDAVFLNDLAQDAAGSIYISDSGTDKLWVLREGEVQVFAQGTAFKQLNALLLEGSNLLIGSVAGAFMILDLKTKQANTIAAFESGIDGIVPLGQKSYIIAETAGRLWQLGANGSKRLLSDTSSDKISAADIDYDPSSQVLYVPTLFHNTLRAFKLK